MKARDAWANARLVGWEGRGLKADDYDFRSWASAGKGGVPVDKEDGYMGLRLGARYEYAREGRKLRGLLLILNPSRKREPWEAYCERSFERLGDETARDGLFEMIDVLGFLAEPLAANVPFAEVWRTQRELVEQALECGRLWYKMRKHHGITSHCQLGKGAPVELATPGLLETATTASTLHWGGEPPTDADATEAALHKQTPPRQIVDGKEVIALRVDWENFRDDHLKERFGDLVKLLRRTEAGGGNVPPEPKRDMTGKKATVLLGDLTNLRAMRLIHHYEQIAQAVLEARRTGNKSVSDENLYRDAKAAREEFKRTFPFEVEPYHHDTPGRKARGAV